MCPRKKDDLRQDLEAGLVTKITSRLSGLAGDDRVNAVKALSSVLTGDGSFYQALWEADYEERPPTIEEFLDRDEYLGLITGNLYPIWRENLIKIFNPTSRVTEWIIRGAIGTGKTTAAVIALLYKTTLVMHMRNPQKQFGLLEGSPIVVAFFNIMKYLSEDVGFQYFKQALQISPFLKRVGKRNRYGDVVGLPKNIMFAVGADAAHALGLNILIGHLDEANYGRGTVNIKGDEKSQVQKLYVETRDRIDSRYLREGSGDNPGFLIITSSERDESDFLTKHCAKVSSDPQVVISRYALWEAKTALQTGRWFHVFAGDERRDPKLLDPEEVIEYEETGRVVAIPDSPYFRKRFSYDLQGALRNQAGVGSFGFMKFIENRKLYQLCKESSTHRSHPFGVETASLGINSREGLTKYFSREKLCRLVNKSADQWRPLYYPAAPRYIHIDLSKNKDKTGISMTCPAERRMVDRLTPEGHKYRSAQYKVWVDFMLQIKAIPGSEIDFERIREFIYVLQGYGFHIQRVTYDGWQSLESIQMLRKAGLDSKELSVDKKKDPYNLLKAVIYSTCLDFYAYQPLEDELLELMDLPKKIDHPDEGSKDVTDSLAGSVFSLLSDKKLDVNNYLDIHTFSPTMGDVKGSFFELPPELERGLAEAKVSSDLDALFEDNDA